MRALAATLLLCLTASACAQDGPPRELAGLWSAGPAACEAGVGLRFGAEAIEAVFEDDTEVLFERPRYEPARRGNSFSVRIRYDLPLAPGVSRGGSYGEMVLTRRADGWLTPLSNQILDTRTGAVRMRIGADPIAYALTVRPCAENAWIANLRGRAAP